MFHVKLDPRPDAERRGGPGGSVAALERSLTAAQLDRLRAYAALLEERAVGLGLVSGRDRGRIWERHVQDSLRAVPCLRREFPEGTVVDLGSGAGLPGIPVAVALPGREVVLLEPRARAVAFLELTVERLGLTNVRVLRARAEEAGRGGRLAVAVLARAVAPAPRAWRLAAPLLRPSGGLVYFAGSGRASAAALRALGAGVRVRVCSEPAFPWQGPVVIISGTSRPA
ncbi:MAG TPA: 16S rRNA (guanine(527)-N(7))-methyltransferase RsmG [Actinomycetota bacterium]|nr:16S rRNA (guanine(527)-N(7))-methyltransferase RsmG [Actinomycetota bacterium]